MQGGLIPANLPFVNYAAGYKTPFGTWLPDSSGRVAAYVRSTGPQSGDDTDIANQIVTTLNAGLIRCRANRGDVVLVLPGHTENISSVDQMSNLVAGTRILGVGYGTTRPTFTWTANNATFLFDVANTVLDNCILNMDSGAGTGGSPIAVAAPITISAAGCQISNCQIRTSTDANNLATIPITTTNAADDLTLFGLQVYGATAGESTTMFQMLGVDRLRMYNCYVAGATSSTTVGVVRFAATAATDIHIKNCVFQNRKASSVHAVTGVASLSGIVEDNTFAILNDSGLVGFVTPGNTQGGGNRTVNLAGEQAGPTTPIST